MKSSEQSKAEKLLYKLIQDYGSGLPPEERIFRCKDVPAYIHNLYKGNYVFSHEDFKKLMDLIIYKMGCSPS